MKKLPTSEKEYIKKSKIYNSGRGVYAKHNIKKNEIIEICPIIEIPKDDTASLRESILVTYFFYFGKKRQRQAIALGFGSLYNHTYNANAKYEIRSAEKNINFIALEDIKKDDEITIDYSNGNKKNKSPLWFEI